jgi:inner membrane protein
VRWSLGLSLLYVTFGFWQHHRAINVQHALLTMRKQQATQARVLPMPGWLIFWRSIYVANGQLYADGIQVPWIGAARVKLGSSGAVIALRDLPVAAQANAETVRRFNTLEWFAGGYLAQVDGQPPFTIGDQRLTGAIDSLRPLWGLRLDAQGVAQPWRTVNSGFDELVSGLFFDDPHYRPLAELTLTPQ